MGKILFPKYFPICPTDGGDYVVPGSVGVITADIEKTMKMFWRPRKIKISGSYTQSEPITRECIIPVNYELIIQSPYGSEEEMVCEPAESWTVLSSTNVINPESAFYWDSKPFYYGGQDTLFTLNGFEFQLNDGLGFASDCNTGVLIRQLYAIESENAGPFSYQTITIAGVDFKMATYSLDGYGFIQASAEVTEWWSFGGTYYTTTGEPV
jgi:hypothetical protein